MSIGDLPVYLEVPAYLLIIVVFVLLIDWYARERYKVRIWRESLSGEERTRIDRQRDQSYGRLLDRLFVAGVVLVLFFVAIQAFVIIVGLTV